MATISTELIKELFATFGLAYYISENLHRGLSIFYALSSFENMHDMTIPRYEEKLVEVFSLPLGIVIGKVKPVIPRDLQIRLDEALEKRNYLAHHFWFESANNMQSASGINAMLLDLNQIREMLDELDSEIYQLATQRLTEFGVTAEMLEEHKQRLLSGKPEPPLPGKSPLRKKPVRIVQAYEVKTSSRASTLIFVTDDDQLLQLCDVGLGWSNFTQVETNWIVNDVLQQYLPANIDPRPQTNEPWNYEFLLPKNAIFWVTRGRRDKTFRWGIRTARK